MDSAAELRDQAGALLREAAVKEMTQRQTLEMGALLRTGREVSADCAANVPRFSNLSDATGIGTSLCAPTNLDTAVPGRHGLASLENTAQGLTLGDRGRYWERLAPEFYGSQVMLGYLLGSADAATRGPAFPDPVTNSRGNTAVRVLDQLAASYAHYHAGDAIADMLEMNAYEGDDLTLVRQLHLTHLLYRAYRGLADFSTVDTRIKSYVAGGLTIQQVAEAWNAFTYGVNAMDAVSPIDGRHPGSLVPIQNWLSTQLSDQQKQLAEGQPAGWRAYTVSALPGGSEMEQTVREFGGRTQISHLPVQVYFGAAEPIYGLSQQRWLMNVRALREQAGEYKKRCEPYIDADGNPQEGELLVDIATGRFDLGDLSEFPWRLITYLKHQVKVKQSRGDVVENGEQYALVQV